MFSLTSGGPASSSRTLVSGSSATRSAGSLPPRLPCWRASQSPAQVLAHRRPLAVDDAEVGGVAQPDVGDDHVVPEHPLELGRDRRQGGPRALVAGIGLELDPDAAQRLESVLEHQQLRLDVGAGPPGARLEPGPADLDGAILAAHVEIAAAAYRPPGRAL